MELFDIRELKTRAERFGRLLASQNIDCAVLTSNQDLFYFTGSIQKGTLIINSSGEISYFVRKNLSRAQDETPLTVEEWDFTKISSKISGTWSMPFDITTVSELSFYKDRLENMPVKNCSAALSMTKMIKSGIELLLIKKAGIINQKVMEFAKTAYLPGIRDIDIQAEIESYAKTELGHQGHFWLRGTAMEAPSMSLVVSGTDALEPTYTDFPIGGHGLSPAVAQGASGKKITDNFVIDMVGCHFGYCADSTRTFFVKKPRTLIIDTYHELNELLENTVEKIIPGVTGEEIYSFAIELAGKRSWKDFFMGYSQKVKFIGHGIGTEVNQMPVIAPKQNTPFANGMVIAIEPKIFIPDFGVVGLENTYVLENGKLRSITGNCNDINEWIL